MPQLILNLIIALLVAGFVYWVWGKLKGVLAQFIAEPFLGLVDILVLVLVAAIVLFYAIIPLLRALVSFAGFH